MKSVRKSVRNTQKKNRAKYENSALFLVVAGVGLEPTTSGL